MGERSLCMKSMKLLLQTLVCMLLVAVCAFASAEAAVNCYWQLDEVRVETFAENNGCDADITVSAEPLSGLSIPEMISSLRGSNGSRRYQCDDSVTGH